MMTNEDRLKHFEQEDRAKRSNSKRFICEDCGEDTARTHSAQLRCPPCALLRDLEYLTSRHLATACTLCGDKFAQHHRGDKLCAPCQGAKWLVAHHRRVKDWESRHDLWAERHGDDETAYNATIESEAAEAFIGRKPKHRSTVCLVPDCDGNGKIQVSRALVAVCVRCASSAERRPVVLQTLRVAQAARRTRNQHEVSR